MKNSANLFPTLPMALHTYVSLVYILISDTLNTNYFVFFNHTELKNLVQRINIQE